MNNWQPIETAPKDGKEILVWAAHPGWVYTAVYSAERCRWLASSGGTPCYPDDGSCGEYALVHEELFPTDWMPCPSDPGASETSL